MSHNHAQLPQHNFSFAQRLQLAVLPVVLADLFYLLYRTCSVETRGREHHDETLRRHGRCHVVIWHESMAMAGCYNRGTDYLTLTSHSYDGEFAARVIKRWRIHAARGSSSRGGSEALKALAEAAKTVPVTGFTLDGPKGPRRVAKSGIGVLAARTQLPIVPNAYAVSSAWRLNSWDKFPIQKPFARIICAYAPAIPPPPDDSPEAVEATRSAVEKSLNDLHAQIERDLGGAPIV
ncbi:MAG TPA: DUF374 domain-containing protein [Candidatus Hydrogenedentes bacterium]|nr:DUF374 domain-containing protein [Candidatus Hydrogenedentota bacterium]